MMSCGYSAYNVKLTVSTG